MKKTKIICTIGPASINKGIIKRMQVNGMNAARINTSYGDYKQYDTIIRNVRSAAEMPVILDTQGPEVRILNNNAFVKKGDLIELKLSVNVYSKLKKGIKVLINDGLIEGVISKVNKSNIIVLIKSSGELVKYRNIVFKNYNLNLPVLTLKDVKSLKYAVRKKVEFIALSYTRSSKDVELVKKKLENSGVLVIAKIEDKLGVKNHKEIIKASDAVMIARGDLGVEIPSEKIPLIQKDIISECNKLGRPVIVATQMMESMITNTSPTRAETSDVANAILDGADCVMLSGETSIGKHPPLVVKTMKKICLNTERSEEMPDFEIKSKELVDNITSKAFNLSVELNARIICLTRSGYTARMISRFKPEREIIAFTKNKMVKNQLLLSFGVKPFVSSDYDNYDVKKITTYCLKNKLIKAEDLIVFVAGLFIKNTTNTITVFKAGSMK